MIPHTMPQPLRSNYNFCALFSTSDRLNNTSIGPIYFSPSLVVRADFFFVAVIFTAFFTDFFTDFFGATFVGTGLVFPSAVSESGYCL